MQRHVSRCVTVEKQIKKKITETEKKEEQKKGNNIGKVKILNCFISFCQQT